MNHDIFFTLAEYKENYERLKKEFVNAYVDNDEEEFISLQTEWYKRCVENTIVECGIIADYVGWDTKARISGEGFVSVVDKRIRNERGGVNMEAAQNMNVSFGKIIKFLRLQNENVWKNNKENVTATQWALYFFILHKCKFKPYFQEKVKEIEVLSMELGLGAKNFQMKYNEINNKEGLEGYSQKDVVVVEQLLKRDYPAAIPRFKDITLHIN